MGREGIGAGPWVLLLMPKYFILFLFFSMFLFYGSAVAKALGGALDLPLDAEVKRLREQLRHEVRVLKEVPVTAPSNGTGALAHPGPAAAVVL